MPVPNLPLFSNELAHSVHSVINQRAACAYQPRTHLCSTSRWLRTSALFIVLFTPLTMRGEYSNRMNHTLSHRKALQWLAKQSDRYAGLSESKLLAQVR